MPRIIGLNLAIAITALSVNGLNTTLKADDVDRLKKKKHFYTFSDMFKLKG